MTPEQRCDQLNAAAMCIRVSADALAADLVTGEPPAYERLEAISTTLDMAAQHSGEAAAAVDRMMDDIGPGGPSAVVAPKGPEMTGPERRQLNRGLSRARDALRVLREACARMTYSLRQGDYYDAERADADFLLAEGLLVKCREISTPAINGWYERTIKSYNAGPSPEGGAE